MIERYIPFFKSRKSATSKQTRWVAIVLIESSASASSNLDIGVHSLKVERLSQSFSEAIGTIALLLYPNSKRGQSNSRTSNLGCGSPRKGAHRTLLARMSLALSIVGPTFLPPPDQAIDRVDNLADELVSAFREDFGRGV